METIDLIRNFQRIKAYKYNEEKYKTATSIDQVQQFANSYEHFFYHTAKH